MTDPNLELDERTRPLTELLGRCGATELQIRYHDDLDPIVWIALATFNPPDRGHIYETAAAFAPLTALERLAAQLIDGGQCVHCGRTSSFHPTFDDSAIVAVIKIGGCPIAWDPELTTYRQHCAGDTGQTTSATAP